MNQKEVRRLKIACQNGNHEGVREICKKHPAAISQRFPDSGVKPSQVTWRDSHRVAALHLSSKCGHVECCRVLLDFGADVEAKDMQDHTALMFASTREVMELLISRGADVNARDVADMTALHHCASARLNKRCVGELVSAGASVNAGDIYGYTPLMVFIQETPAPSSGDVNVDSGVELVRRGAAANTTDRRGQTLLHLCSGVMNKEVMERKGTKLISELVHLGADVDARTKVGNTPLHFAILNFWFSKGCVSQLVSLGAKVNASDKDGNTPLMLAVLNKRRGPEVSALLIDLGADVNMCNEDGETALHLAAKNGYSGHAEELVKASAGTETCNKDGNTPLHLAAGNGHEDNVCVLVAAGAKVAASNNRGETALHLGAKNGRKEVVCQLIKSGAPLEARDSFGCTALLAAVKRCLTMTAAVLREAGANQEASDNKGNTSLHLAVQSGRNWLVTNVIAAGANVQVCNNDGESALLLAIKKDFGSAANTLLNAGAEAETRDNESNSPLSVASKRGDGELCCELVRRGAKVDGTISFFECLRIAVITNRTDLISRLVEIGASINECGTDGSSLLHIAIRNEQLLMAKWIIKHGGNVSCTNTAGWTPLHIAAQVSSLSSQALLLDTVKLLISRGADPAALTSDSKTPRDVAKERYDYVIARFLEKAELAQQLVEAGGEARSPDSVAIRFGGPPGAGKSTLTRALRVTRFRSRFRNESQADEAASNVRRRTKGINCQAYVSKTSARFAIFDLGGHGEFLATHQMFIGDGSVPVIDCVVVSTLDPNLKNNAFKWCSLFASRNHPSAVPWPLVLIATRADTTTEQQQHAVHGVYHDIKQTFGLYFRFLCSKPLFIDARKSWAALTVELRQVLNQLHHELVTQDNSPRQPAICQSIEENLPALRKTTPCPIILKERFIAFMLPRIEYLDQPATLRKEINSLISKALKYLSGYATVLSFEQPLAQRYVVINPRWLLSDIVGRLMAEPPLPGPYIHYDNGYAKTSDVIAALETEHLPGREALEMVASLGFCLEQKSADTVLNPSKLRVRRLDRHWRRSTTMVVNAGRRLKCKGSVAIASAFFPHLQVYFYHRYLSDFDEKLPMWTGGIRLVAGQRSSVEALIESDPTNLSIDIIVRGREGSEKECSDLLHSLTEETLEKAVEISPGSQLCLFFLSKLELDELSPAGLPSRPLVEYSEERVLRAIVRSEYVTDGDASTPENPDDLLLPRHFRQRSALHAGVRPESAEPLTQSLSVQDWRVVLLRLANAVNNYAECEGLAKGLHLNGRSEKIVEKLLQVDPQRLSSDVAFSLFDLWLQREATELSTEQRRTTLCGVFQADLRRSDLCDFLDDELRAMCSEDGLQKQ